MAVTLAQTFTDNSRKEDVSDIITIIDPTDTPVLANIGEQDIENPDAYEWQIDALAGESQAGQEDGFDFDDITDSVTERTKLVARCQIQAKGVKISERRDQNAKYGLDSELAYQLAKRSEEMKRDCESTILLRRGPTTSASGVAPLCAGIPAWIRSNISLGGTGGGATPQAPALTGTTPAEPDMTSADDGSVRALDESVFLDLIGQCYDEGGNPDMIVVPRAVKQLMSQYFFSQNARIATPYQDHGKSPASGLQVVGAVDYYVSDFGVLAIVPNRLMPTAEALILDTSMWEKGTFRGYEMHEIAKDGDHQKYMLVHDFTLISRDEAASARFAAIDTSPPMVQ